MPSAHRLVTTVAFCGCFIAPQLAKSFSPPSASYCARVPTTIPSSTQLHTSSMGGGRRGSARGESMVAKEQEKRRIESIEVRRKKKMVIEDGDSSVENDGAGSASINAEECTIIDDELEEELKKLGDLEPLERQLIRLEGLEPYVLVSVLTATASYSTITSEEFIVDGVVDWTGAGLLASALGSTLCGLYSTTIFSLSILYGKTALGMDREATYFYFLDKTAAKRFRGFQAFSLSLLLFCTSILLLSIDKLPEGFRIPACIVASAFVFFGFSEWSDITDAAQPIFTNVIPVDDDDDDESFNLT